MAATSRCHAEKTGNIASPAFRPIQNIPLTAQMSAAASTLTAPSATPIPERAQRVSTTATDTASSQCTAESAAPSLAGLVGNERNVGVSPAPQPDRATSQSSRIAEPAIRASAPTSRLASPAQRELNDPQSLGGHSTQPSATSETPLAQSDLSVGLESGEQQVASIASTQTAGPAQPAVAGGIIQSRTNMILSNTFLEMDWQTEGVCTRILKLGTCSTGLALWGLIEGARPKQRTCTDIAVIKIELLDQQPGGCRIEWEAPIALINSAFGYLLKKLRSFPDDAEPDFKVTVAWEEP